MGEARVCIRCGTRALAGRFSCNECGGAIVYAATPDPVPAPAYAPALTDPAPSPPPSDDARSDPNWAPSPANWAPSTTPQSEDAPTAHWAPPTPAPIDEPAFVPRQAHIGLSLHRRSHNAVVAANFLIGLAVVGLLGLGVIAWSVFGGGGGRGGVPPALRPYTNAAGGQIYTTPQFRVRLPADYKIEKLSVKVGGYDVNTNVALSKVDDVVVLVMSGSTGGASSTEAIAHMPGLARRLALIITPAAEATATIKTVTWHGGPAYDVAGEVRDLKYEVRFVVQGRQVVAMMVAAPKEPSSKIMRTLLDSYERR